MNKPLIIGVGNRFRGDDSIGLIIAEKLSTDFDGDVDVVFCEGDPMELMDLWKYRDPVFIIDAVTSASNEVGHVHTYDISIDPVPVYFNNTSTHFLDVIQIVELARALNTLPKTVYLYGIEAKHFSMDDSLSEGLSSQLLRISKDIDTDIRTKVKGNCDSPKKIM